MKANLRALVLTAASLVFANQARANSIDTDRFNGRGDLPIQNQSNEWASEQWCYDRASGPDHTHDDVMPKTIWLCNCIEQQKMRYSAKLGKSNIRMCNPTDIRAWLKLQTHNSAQVEQ